MRTSNIQPPLGTPINKSHPLSQGLVGCWSMNEGGGGKLFDISSFNSEATFNAPTWASYKQMGKCASFVKASSGYATSPPHSNLDILEGISVSGWVTLNSATGFAVLFFKGHDSSFVNRPENYAIDTGSDGLKFRFYYTNSNAFQVYEVTNFFTVGIPVFFTITHIFGSSSNITVYKNGIPQSGSWTVGSGNNSPSANTDLLYIASFYTGASITNFLDCYMNNLMLWNRRLTPTEVKQLYINPNQMFQNDK